MRIVIETSDEGHPPSTSPSVSAETPAGGPRLPDRDGGGPSDALLAALGGRVPAAEPAPQPGPARQGSDGGAAPAWLVGVIEAAKRRTGAPKPLSRPG